MLLLADMRTSLLACVVGLGLGACTVGPGGTSPGDDDQTPPDAPNQQRECSLPNPITDPGTLNAPTAQQCNVPGSMGAQKFYRMFATLPGGNDIIQIELYDGRGPFAAGAVAVGSHPVDADPATCGVCVRALGDKGQATALEYFATGGTVDVTAVGGDGQPFTANVTTADFKEINPTTRAVVTGGCTATMATANVTGTIVAVMGGGGGGGGCPTTIGD